MIYGFRGRVFAFCLPAFGLAIMAPAGGTSGFQGFVLSPPGLAFVALALMALGASVEDTGTLRRIRLGVGLRLLAAALLVPAAAWAGVIGAPSSSLATFGWGVAFVGLALVTGLARRDAGVFADPRHAQDTRLESISRDALRLVVHGKALSIPSGAVRRAAVGSNLEGRVALIEVSGREAITGDADALAWIARGTQGDTFVLTEHQAGLDAEVLAQRVLEAAAAAREGGYR